MVAINKLHHKSLELSDEALVSKAKGNEHAAKVLYEKAFWLEKEAALMMPPEHNVPVPRPVLLRSAASLAYKAGLFREAEKLIAICEAENVPEFVSVELENLKKLIEKEKPKLHEGHLNITGKLTSANEHENEIMVEETETQKPYTIVIPTSKLKDIVRAYFSEIVQVQASASPHGMFMLEKISKVA